MKKNMFLLSLFSVVSLIGFAQTELPAVDKSPMDMCYYPVQYPNLKAQGSVTEPLTARVIYSRPKKEGRAVFGGLVEYGKLWRLGANEATEIEFYRPVMIGGKKVAKGRYTLFAVVNEGTWTFIINKETDIWGSYNYSQSKDVARVTVPVRELNEPVESLAMTFKKDGPVIRLTVAWENVEVGMPISL